MEPYKRKSDSIDVSKLNGIGKAKTDSAIKAKEKALAKQAAKETPETAAAATAVDEARITMERLIAAEEGKGQIARAYANGHGDSSKSAWDKNTTGWGPYGPRPRNGGKSKRGKNRKSKQTKLRSKKYKGKRSTKTRRHRK